MKIRIASSFLAFCALTLVLGATPPEPDQRAATTAPAEAALGNATTAPSDADPGAPTTAPVDADARALPSRHAQPRIGAAPKPQYRVNNRTFALNAKEPGVTAVRAMPPKSFEPASRVQSVNGFYKKQFAGKAPSKEQLASLSVGPYRREFIWWALNSWAVNDRAWWAWNNYAYFDQALWNQWMLNREFADLIAQYQAQNLARQPGFIPPQYAGSAPEAVYNDDYIDAVYNPEPTPPSIIVDSTAGGRLSNLVDGAPRIFGRGSKSISSIADRVKRYQFVSIPADFDPVYQITVKRDGDLYAFGSKKTPAAEAFGADAANWKAVSNLVNGPGVEVTWQRKVKAGDKIHIHAMEWSIASEQIQLLSPASPEALVASRHLVHNLELMTTNKGAFVQANHLLADYTDQACDAARRMITENGNIDDDAVADCRYELSHLQKLAKTALARSSDAQTISAGKDFIGKVSSLQDSMNETEGLHDPASAVQQSGVQPK